MFGVASYAAVFRVAPPLSPHKLLWGERGSETKNGCVGEAMFGVDQYEFELSLTPVAWSFSRSTRITRKLAAPMLSCWFSFQFLSSSFVSQNNFNETFFLDRHYAR